VPGRDPYESLGVPKGATGDVVRKAYRRLAREHHPDANLDDPAAEERFKEIQQAYDILTDPGKRQAYYDEKRSSRPSPRRKRAGAPRTTAGGRVGQTTGAVNLSDLIAKRVNAKRVNVSGLRTGGHREVEWQLGGADLARIAKVFGVDLSRLSKLVGGRIQMNAKVCVGNGPGKNLFKPTKTKKPPGV
jgi:DnaJ-class molecular chaperone